MSDREVAVWMFKERGCTKDSARPPSFWHDAVILLIQSLLCPLIRATVL